MGKMAEDRPRAVYLADVLKALAHPERLRIVAVLCEGERNVIGLAGSLCLQQALVSQHLRILRMSGLVASQRRGGYAVYALAQPRLRSLVECLEGCHAVSPENRTARKTAAAIRRAALQHRGGHR